MAADPEVPAAETGVPGGDRGGRLPPDRGDPAVAPPDLAAARPGRTRTTVFEAISKSTRQRIRKARGTVEVVVVRHDAPRARRTGRARGSPTPAEPAEVALDRFYDLLLETGERRHFTFGPRDAVRRLVARGARRPATSSTSRRGGTPRRRRSPVWSCIATAAASRPSTPATIAMERAGRLPARCTSCAGGRSSSRSARGAARWTSVAWTSRASRGEPHEGDPLYGLYQHKQSFGGQWLELTGAHERVFDPTRLPARAPGRPRRTAGRPMTEPTIAELLAAAELAGPVELGGLIDRLTAEGRLRGARRDGRAIGAAGLADDPGPRRHPRLAGRSGPGRCSWRSPGSTPTATTSWPRRPRPAPPPRSSTGRSPTSTCPQLVVDDTRLALATAAAWWYGDPSARAGGRRDHRHGRQDDDLVPRHGGPRGGRDPDRDDRHGRDPDRRRPGGQRGSRDDPGGTRAPARPARDAGRRRRGRGHRDDLARPGARPRRRDRLRRRDPDEPDPRAPRAPRHVGGVPRRQAEALREARPPAGRSAAGRPAATSRSPGRPPGSSTPTTRRRARSSASPRKPAPGS